MGALCSVCSTKLEPNVPATANADEGKTLLEPVDTSVLESEPPKVHEIPSDPTGSANIIIQDLQTYPRIKKEVLSCAARFKHQKRDNVLFEDTFAGEFAHNAGFQLLQQVCSESGISIQIKKSKKKLSYHSLFSNVFTLLCIFV